MDSDPGTACRTRPDARHAAGFRTMKPVAQCDDDNYGAQYLHLRYGRSSAIPLASRNSLPPYFDCVLAKSNASPISGNAYVETERDVRFTPCLLGSAEILRIPRSIRVIAPLSARDDHVPFRFMLASITRPRIIA